MNLKKRILVAPLNWGLGHATRCIPIVQNLLVNNFEVIIASDGKALKLLEKEFPDLIHLELPSYNIEYSKNRHSFKLKFLKLFPKLLKAIKLEQKFTKNIIESYKVNGIISDNRFGVYSDKIPSVYITHQLNVLSGNTTWLSSKMHQYIIKKFKECWVPDIKSEPNLSGKLGHINSFPVPIKYLGIISRFQKIKMDKKYDLLILLSGPEPQRSMLEKLLLEKIKDLNGNILFVKGVVEDSQTSIINGNITIVNYMQSDALEAAINQSEIILSRSGYTTILDLAKLGKKAFFIPTSGQFEQEYLAKQLAKKGIAPYATQTNFTLSNLNEIKKYKGFEVEEETIDFKLLFRLFECK